jgi:hypothetical protein
MEQLSLEFTNRWKDENWEDQNGDGRDRQCMYDVTLRALLVEKE